MSFETLKEQVDLLADSGRRRLMAYLVSIEHSKNAEHAERIGNKIESKDLVQWLTLEEVEKRLQLNDGNA